MPVFVFDRTARTLTMDGVALQKQDELCIDELAGGGECYIAFHHADPSKVWAVTGTAGWNEGQGEDGAILREEIINPNDDLHENYWPGQDIADLQLTGEWDWMYAAPHQ